MHALGARGAGGRCGSHKASMRACQVQSKRACMQEVPIVIDADGLKVVCSHPDAVRGYRRVVLTPNAPELWRLADALNVSHEKKPPHQDPETVQVCNACIVGIS